MSTLIPSLLDLQINKPNIAGDIGGSYSSPTVTTTNGVPFSASATTDTTNAGNISSGILPTGRLNGTYSSCTSGAAESINVTAISGNANFYFTLLSASFGGNNVPLVASNLLFNPGTGLLTAPTINVSNLTASSLVATDSSKNLTNNTSALSPTFSALTITNSATAVNFISQTATTVSSGGQVVLTQNSAQLQLLTGTSNETFKLPNGTTLTPGYTYYFNNNSTGTLTVNDSSNNLIVDIPAGGMVRSNLTSTSGVAGTWDYHWFAPTNVSWGSSTFSYPGTITSATWNGNVIAETYGGTNQSTYILGDMLYSSAANTLSKLSGNTTLTRKFLRQTGTGTVSAAPAWDTINASDITTGLALTSVNDTNVTLTLGGTPATALLQSTSLTLGWTGTLSATRMNFNSTNLQNSSGALNTIQNINSTASPTFGGLTVVGSGLIGITIGSTTGSAIALINRGAISTDVSVIRHQDLGSNVWDAGTISGSSDYYIRDLVNSVNIVHVGAGSGTTSLVTFAGNVAISGLSANSLIATNGSNQLTNSTSSLNVNFSSLISGPSQSTAAFSRIALTGTNASPSAGPYQAFYTASDQYPLLHMLPYSHNNVSFNFDSYFDISGAWKSSSSGSNYQIYKMSNQMQFNYASGIAAGSTVTWTTAFYYDTNGDLTANGNVIVNTAGKTLKVKQGSNACFGSATLSSGTVTVSTTAVATGDAVFLSCTAASGTQGIVRVSAISSGASFTLTSSNGTDASTYNWLIIKAA